MRSVTVIVLVIVAALGAASPTFADVRETIEHHNSELERLYAEGKADSAALFFAEDTWQMPPNSPPVVGREAYIEFWTQAFQWGSWHFDFMVQDVVAADGIAVERGKYTLAYEAGPESPFPTLQDKGNYVVMWRRDPDGEWRIVWDAPVSEIPMGGPPE